MSEQEPSEAADGTGRALVQFVQRLGKQGQLNANTAGSYASACQKVLEIDDGWEERDVRDLEVSEQLDRFVNLRHTRYTAGSLETYRTRFSKAFAMYLEYLEDPSAFKPRRTVRIPRKSPDSSPPADRTRQPTGHEPSADLVLFSFPVRPGVLAELHLPPDLTDAETRRLSAFVTALAIDQPVSD